MESMVCYTMYQKLYKNTELIPIFSSEPKRILQTKE